MTHSASYTIQPKRKRHTAKHSPAQKALLGTSALTTFAAFAVSVAMPNQAFAVADPSTLTTVSGGVSHNLTAPGQLQTTQTTNRAIIQGPNVDVLDGESWRIMQPSSSSALLVRVNGGSPTKILGELTANGQLMLVNGSGVFFGKNSQVNVAGLIASTADISNENFIANNLKFDRPGHKSAAIINHGSITAKEGGLVALLAPGVQNDGVIVADAGSVAIGAGETFTLDFYGDDLYRFSVDTKANAKAVNENGDEMDAAITNNGTVKGGRVFMTARAAREVVDSAINTTGIVEATNARNEGGVIVLDGGEGSVNLAGAVKARGTKGGSITVASTDHIQLAANASVDASGDTTGGTIRIGGDKKGGGTLARAATLNVEKGATIDASGNTGNAGDVVLWSDKETVFRGDIDISSKQGNGGFAEVSSKDTLTYDGFTVATGKNLGTLLLDPGDWTISNGANSGNNQNITSLVNQLNVANVTIDTTTATPQPGDLGDITLVNNMAWNGPGSLTLNAQNDITFNANLTSNFVGGDGSQGALILNAGNSLGFSFSKVTTGSGNVTGSSKALYLNKASITSGTGDITLGNTFTYSNNTAGSINTGGDVTINQHKAGSIKNVIDSLGTVGGEATVVLLDGVFTENLLINRSVNVISQNGAGATTLNGKAGKGVLGTVVIANGVNDVQIGAAGKGITINGGGKPASGYATVNLLGNNSDIVISGNTINSLAKTHAVLVTNSTGATIGGASLAEGNIIANAGDEGVRITGSSNVLVGFNTISNSTDNSILAFKSNNVTVNGNVITKSGSTNGAAINFVQSSNVTATNNNIDGSKRHGINLGEVTGLNLVDGNTIDNVTTHGVFLSNVAGSADGTSGVTVSNNQLLGDTKGGSGVATTNAAFAKITGNTIQDYAVGVNVNSSAGTEVSGNIITLNPFGVGVIVNGSSNNSVLTGNVVNGTNDTIGLSINNSNNVTLSGNTTNNNLVGIRLDNAQGTTLFNETLNNNILGLYAFNNSGGTKMGSSTFNNGGIAVVLEGAGTDFAFSDDGSNFNGPTGFFSLSDGAMNGQILDASQQTFNGTRAINFTTAQYLDARSRTLDSETVAGVGFVFYRPVPFGISQELLDQTLLRDIAAIRDTFSYNGKTIGSSYVVSPYNFRVQGVNLSLLAPAAGNTVAPITAGINPANLGDLSPAAGGNTDQPVGTALASLAPAAGGSAGESCGNGFLAGGLGGACGGGGAQ